MLDKIIIEFDKMLKVLTVTQQSDRVHPDKNIAENEMLEAEVATSVSLMRINHSGEICAQALYQGQALTARDKSRARVFQEAAFEEIEHLAWTEKRVLELGGRTSFLNPFLYVGSFAIGVTAGLLGDKWSLSFLEETEKQVENHLGEHLDKLPVMDQKSRAIVEQMKIDEASHAKTAHDNGAAEMPSIFKVLMSVSSKLMTKSTYYI
jgi:3-demethoxyubiquinol 3-hydroxylase